MLYRMRRQAKDALAAIMERIDAGEVVSLAVVIETNTKTTVEDAAFVGAKGHHLTLVGGLEGLKHRVLTGYEGNAVPAEVMPNIGEGDAS